MPVRRPHINESGLYFITFTNYKWLPLIRLTEGYDLVYKWFDTLNHCGHEICGYVIMPNHLHALIGFNHPTQGLNTIIGNGKRFMAYGIVRRLQAKGLNDILHELSAGVQSKDRSRGKLHEVFEPSFNIQACNNLSELNTRLNYMHNNPLTGKWDLAKDAISYEHSSSKYYETGQPSVYPVVNVIDVFDKDWD